MVVLGLATARLTQLVVEDEITESARMAVSALAEPPNRPVVKNGGVHYEAAGDPHPFWDKIDTAINCYACTSVWAAGGVILASSTGRVGRFLTHVLALSQAALAAQAVIGRIER
jgi:hypothetical protein